jgi:hypothetical protein
MKKAAYGSKLAIQIEQTGSYTDLASIGDISGPSISAETIDVTTHDSADAFAEFVAGMLDGGEVSTDLVFESGPSGHGTLYNAVADRQLHNFYLKLPGWVSTGAGGYFAFAGLLTAFNVTAPVKDKLGAAVTIKVSGKPVFHPFTS